MFFGALVGEIAQCTNDIFKVVRLDNVAGQVDIDNVHQRIEQAIGVAEEVACAVRVLIGSDILFSKMVSEIK